VPDGDTAIYLTHIFSRYVPHFIALSVSSPFQQGEDTSYQSSRLNTVSAFPLSGQMPFVRSWGEFLEYFDKMRGYGIVEATKDFYWDIRPRPGYGTVEIRVFDTPLSVDRAAALAAYVQGRARRRGRSICSTTTTASRRAATGSAARSSTPTAGGRSRSRTTCSRPLRSSSRTRRSSGPGWR
jgi:gamma-glutamyl:cysteine ligase YbdK (ATP-grasp superfamily)